MGIVKGKYSRLGCIECKKRKIKCDESKPVCWHCHRLSKLCEYPALRTIKNNVVKVRGIGETVLMEDFRIDEEHKPYLHQFFVEYSKIIIPLSKDENPARNIILRNAITNDDVLYAVLACGALIRHKSNSDTTSNKHKEKYLEYLEKCLGSLSDSLQRFNKSVDIVTTILLLTSYNALSNIFQWRPHLKIAGDMLFSEPISSSDGNEFCKIWFISLEIIASLSTSQGGTIENHEQWNHITDWLESAGNILENIGIEIPVAGSRSNFNVLIGVNTRLLIVICKVILLIKKKDTDLNISDVTSVLCELERPEIKKFSIVDSSGYNIHEGDEWIEFPDDTGIIMGTFISWKDISHQCNRLLCLIIILTSFLKVDIKTSVFQTVIEESICMLRFLKCDRKFNHSMIMIQYFVYVVGQYCKEIHRPLIVHYFDHLERFGNVSYSHSKKTLQKLWTTGITDFSTTSDVISY